MSADPLLYPMEYSIRQEEWLDLDDLFAFPLDYFDSNPTSVNSISPRDYDLSLTDAEVFNWDSNPIMPSQQLFSEFVSYEPTLEEVTQPASDISQSFINPNDVFQPTPPPQEGHMGSGLDSMWFSDTPNLNDPFYSSVRQIVESTAALDPRCSSQKEKRREASIALHMQRLQNASASDSDSQSYSNKSFPSPYWPDTPPGIPPHNRSCLSPASPPLSDTTQKSSTPSSASESAATGMQLVLDLNMNMTTNVPRKQKPRSRAQKENYIKARKYGVCEKHRKQHKRCDCLEKAAVSHLSGNGSSSVGPDRALGLNFNSQQLHTNPPLQRHVMNAAKSANVIQPSSPEMQPARVPRPDLSPTRSVRPLVPAGVQCSVISQSPHPFPPGESSLSNTPASFAVSGYTASSGKHQFKIRPLERRSLQPLCELADSRPSSVNRDPSTVQLPKIAGISRAKQAGTVVHKTTIGLLSFWQGSSALSSLAGSIFGRLFMFSSGLYMRSRKGIGLFF
ncbi:hypothetical protein ARAM_004908 [Aspergillus rambellii]|uniref:Uncharacterized protein n=1 Tax=Aspergillus rambellii TaxID=308745 RepID=A0A0F8UVB8_9EURO|nr:hypothetical protein ARAM_004908 [Aspergillus rambellii]